MRPRLLYIDHLGICKVIPAEWRSRFSCRMKKCQHQTSRFHHLMQSCEDRLYQSLGQKISSIPQDDNIKLPSREIQVRFKKPTHIKSGLISVSCWYDPFRL